ncbi:MAG TPA: TetR family transcriptional regulator [Burkholderiaceae bacterium]|nr:TetR family transcriptional regulator [Burkholderiaceae bacterium]
MRKGEQTRSAILAAACELAARDGLEGLTIGALADHVRMSKSGVFAHFGSREDLQIAVLKAYEQRFVDDVLVPGLQAPRGLARLREIVGHWLDRTAVEAASACIWISGASEYDDRPGSVRDTLVGMVRSWQRELARAIRQAVDTGELRADTDPSELVFGLYGVIMALHHDSRLLDSPDALPRARRAFDRLVESYRTPVAAPAAPLRRRIAKKPATTTAAATKLRRPARPVRAEAA